LSFTLYYTIIGFVYGKCPAADLIKPCTCDTDYIFCGGNIPIDLKNLFHNLSTTLGKDKKNFKAFFLNNTTIEELPENTFGDIIFDSINNWNAPNLSLIHTNAFNELDYELNINNTTLKNSPPNHDLFHAISSLININVVYLINNMIEEIPDYAFKPINGPQNNLSSLYISDNNIKRIGNFAFEDLNHLNILSICSNQIVNITKNLFSFENSSDSSLTLDFRDLPLNGESFESEAFNNLKRPTTIDMSLTGENVNRTEKVTYLDQHIFEEFFSKDHRNEVTLNTIDCKDCRSYWLVKNDKYESRAASMRCSDGTILDKFFKVFPNCEHFV
jgi:Leucine-rich repeat (LRR) protein